MELEFISGGITAPKGFRAGGVHCGIRRNTSKRDLMLILADDVCRTAAVYTQNLVKGAPILVTQANIADDRAHGIIANSGNANTCNTNGLEIAEKMCELAAKACGLAPSDFVVASTGVIGQELDVAPIERSIPELFASLSSDSKGSEAAAQAIMTTDLQKKELCVKTKIGETEIKIGVIAKGSGMIHPNMATLLGFVTTDALISQNALKSALSSATLDTFNMISVDGDTSTNDTVCILSSGKAENAEIEESSEEYEIFLFALKQLLTKAAKLLARDGEGATKLIECYLTGAPDEATAKMLAKSVIASPLVKSAIFGCDANWGRVLCALGYAGRREGEHENADYLENVSVTFSRGETSLAVCAGSKGVPFSEEVATEILSGEEVTIEINLHQGDGFATAWGCDLTYDYVKINGDYRT